jgi:hypothetical protein
MASGVRGSQQQQLEALRRDLRRLQLEHDLLEKANEIVKKEMGIDRRLLTNQEKAQLVDALKQGARWQSSWEEAWRAVPTSITELGSTLWTSTPGCVAPWSTSSSTTIVAMDTVECRLR